ncbi:cation acetate symporter [Kineosporia sp. A_224]|uniref:sodium/solute symporter n=1 Tax=Kineosporia sp. A_224 TaxID=1962180 RepID=UPI000B4B8B13|nr:cation acetate symporter [Kineosporia sp. A_224]
MVSTDTAAWPAVLSVILVAVATLGVGAVGLRLSRTTSDFYVASRMIGPRWNASAICGEYLSAASFLGVAGLVLTFGVDILWYPVGYTAGYLVLLALVAAPLRRSGAYTLPDFAEIRLASRTVRRLASMLVVGIGWLYLLPQFQGAGLALRTVTGAPRWVGALVVGVVVMLNVVAGGMRSVTFVQAFQFWLKLTAIAVRVLILAVAWQSDGAPDPSRPQLPTVREATTVRVPDTVRLRVDEAVPVTMRGTLDGVRVDGPVVLETGRRVVEGGSEVTLPAGSVVPHVESVRAADGATWSQPLAGAGGRDHPTYRLYSLLLALFFGTMGLPHVLVRFYTNPDGRAARRTTLVVIGLLGAFYVFTPFYGAMGRIYAPDLLLTGRTDAVVLLLPSRMLPEPWATGVSMLLVAGAFAAFLSTSSGLTVSVAGVLSQDLLRGRLRSTVRGFRLGAVLAVAVPIVLSFATLRTSLADTVGLAFAVAASTFCPLLVLGIWWRGLTKAGAVAGLVVGGSLASGAVLWTIVFGARFTDAATSVGSSPGLLGALLAQPAAWTVPTAFAVMVGVSLLTRRTVPKSVGRTMVRLHTPERLVLDRGPSRREP